MTKTISRKQLRKLISEEIDTVQSEGFLSNIAAPVSRYIPGGGAALDFIRSRAFDRIETKLEEFEMRLMALERGSP
jgi:hypothetical protein